MEGGISYTCFCLLEWIGVTKNFFPRKPQQKTSASSTSVLIKDKEDCQLPTEHVFLFFLSDKNLILGGVKEASCLGSFYFSTSLVAEFWPIGCKVNLFGGTSRKVP